ncbi:MAG: hypothetical protein R6W76_03405 [Caldilinea sp.]
MCEINQPTHFLLWSWRASCGGRNVGVALPLADGAAALERGARRMGPITFYRMEKPGGS